MFVGRNTNDQMTTPHPGFERSSPDEDVQAMHPTPIDCANSDGITQDPFPPPGPHHHRSNAVAIAVTDLPALHAPPLRPLPLSPAARGYAADSVTAAQSIVIDCTVPTFTITAPNGISIAIPRAFEEDTPLLRSVTPESQLMLNDDCDVAAENDDEAQGEYGDENVGSDEESDTATCPIKPRICQRPFAPTAEPLTIVGEDGEGLSSK